VYCFQATGSSESLYNDDGTLQLQKVKALSRTYAYAIAGDPMNMQFDPSSAYFVLTYKTNNRAKGPTEIYLNQEFWYPDGFQVSIVPPQAASWTQSEYNRIRVIRAPNIPSGQQITVIVKHLMLYSLAVGILCFIFASIFRCSIGNWFERTLSKLLLLFVDICPKFQFVVLFFQFIFKLLHGELSVQILRISLRYSRRHCCLSHYRSVNVILKVSCALSACCRLPKVFESSHTFLPNMTTLLQRWYRWLAVEILKCGPIPKHIAFIMDGNRRYARKIHADVKTGHYLGHEKLKETLEWCLHLGVETVTVFAFSIENFKRPKEEVEALMDLAFKKFTEMLKDRLTWSRPVLWLIFDMI